jgi:hypothetical protein
MLLAFFAIGPFEHEAVPRSVSSAMRGMILLKNFRDLIFGWLSVKVDRQAVDKAARR